MSAVYLTTMGSLYSGDGINVNAIATGDDGWIYVAGIDFSSSDLPNYEHALTIMAYKDGELIWEKDFNDRAYGSFEALAFKDGFIYAAGAISTEFDGQDLAGPDGLTIPAPYKAPLDDELVALYQEKNPWFFQDPTYPIYVKLNGETGSVEFVNVLASPNVQAVDSLSSIGVDSDGNVYVGGGGWNPGPNPDDSFNDAEFYWFTRKFSNSGEVLWEKQGAEAVVLNPFNGTPFLTRYQDQIVELDSNTGVDINISYTGLPYVPRVSSASVQDFIFDAEGSIYTLAARSLWDESISDFSHQTTAVVTKINSSGQVEWSLEFGEPTDSGILRTSTSPYYGNYAYCAPKGITLSPDGNLLISGEFAGNLDFLFDNSPFGGSDGFMVEIDKNSGQIVFSQIIGSSSNESISQVLFQQVLDELGAVVDHNIIIGGSFEISRYSIEGRDEKDIYLITDRGFILIGNALDNIIQGGRGDDSIQGALGNDTLIGGSGNDTVNGGAGDDAIVGGDGAGNDKYDGGGGVDTVKYQSALKGIVVNLSTKGDNAYSKSSGEDSGDAGIGVDQLLRIENIIGGSYSDSLTGNSVSNLLRGEGGNDTLNGGAGADVLIGGLGDDIYIVDNIADTVTEGEGAGTDEVRSSISLSLATNLENLILTGTGKINGTGNALDNVITGNGGANTLNGGAGADTLNGGAGNDIYMVDNSSDTVTEGVRAGMDEVRSSVSFTLGDNLENLVLTGSSDLSASGNSLANKITGNAGANTLDGGAGADTLIGGTGDDIYYVDNIKDKVTESANAGTDSVEASVTYTLGANIENLCLTVADNINGTGNTLNNIIEGESGNNTLNGMAGNDTLMGGLGNDTLVGGKGNDTFVFNTTANATTNLDTITDFNVTDDTIQLENAVFTGLVGTGTLDSTMFRSGAGVTAAGDSSDRIAYNTTTGALYYDADGLGGTAAVQIALIGNKANLTVDDLVVI